MKNFVNQKQLSLLEKTSKDSSPVGAYLFCGPAKVGKSEAVFDFVCALNNFQDRQQVEVGANPDVIIVEPEIEEKANKRRKKDISIEQIKQAVKSIGYYAYQAKYKFLIIKEADRMTNTAANSLLKIMEETVSDTVIILVSNSEAELLSTIRSRCQTVRFGLATNEELILQLRQENSQFSKNELQKAIDFSQGRIVRARELLADSEKLVLIQESLGIFRKALKNGVVEGLKLSEELSSDKEKLKEMLGEIVWYLRELIKKQLAVGADRRVVNKIVDITEKIVQLNAEIATSNVNQRLQLENFFVQL